LPDKAPIYSLEKLSKIIIKTFIFFEVSALIFAMCMGLMISAASSSLKYFFSSSFSRSKLLII